MHNLRFYDVPVHQPGGFGFLFGLIRRAARKLSLPFFERQVEILGEVCERLDEQDGMRTDITRAEGRVDALNHKLDLLNTKFDALNLKMEGLLRAFGDMQQREAAIRDEFAAVIALNWDHVAVGRRLAQLEDRLLLDGSNHASDSDPSIIFPGLERFERRTG